jgi:hypothetical protein
MTSLLFGVSATDALSFVIAGGAVLSIARISQPGGLFRASQRGANITHAFSSKSTGTIHAEGGSSGHVSRTIHACR